MFARLKRLFAKSAPAASGPAAKPAVADTGFITVHRAMPKPVIPAGDHQTGANGDTEHPAPPPLQRFVLPLAPIVEKFPAELKEILAQPPAPGQTVSLEIEDLPGQLRRGSVRITFGDLRHANAASFTGIPASFDHLIIQLPISLILPKIKLTPRMEQRRIIVPQSEGIADFDLKRSTSEPEPAPAPPAEEKLPMPADLAPTDLPDEPAAPAPPADEPPAAPAAPLRIVLEPKGPLSMPVEEPLKMEEPPVEDEPASATAEPDNVLEIDLDEPAEELPEPQPEQAPPVAPLRIEVPPAPVPDPQNAPEPVSISPASSPAEPLEDWRPAAVARRIHRITGVNGIIIASRDGLVVASEVGSEIDASVFAAFLPEITVRTTVYLTEMNLPAPESMQISLGSQSLLVAQAGDLFLGALIRFGCGLTSQLMQEYAQGLETHGSTL